MLSVVLIGFSLSMDAFAVSVSSGVSIRDLKIFHAFRASFFFGFFQFAMPVAGWYLGRTFAARIQAVDHWVAFGLLALIGGKMLFEALKGEKKNDASASQRGGDIRPSGPFVDKYAIDCPAIRRGGDIRSLPCLFALAVATSIDALAVGLSFSLLGQGIWGSAFLIAGITFAVCLTGFEFGRRIGTLLEKWAEIAGGLILIGIGTKILLEHLIEKL
jgi:putative Mn2+ efflux pump MntP